MAAMDLQAIRDFVLVSLDTDTEEIPNTLLDVYIGEGFDRAINEADNWSFYAQQENLVTVADTQSYNFGGNDTDRDDAFAYPYHQIVAIREATWNLFPSPHADMLAAYSRDSSATGRPRRVSEFGSSFFLWPTPDSAYTLTISGYREAIDWIALGASAEPDLPSDYHSLIAYHALARRYAQQGDPEMASYYHSLYDVNIRQMKEKYATPTLSGPYILNGGVCPQGYRQNGIAWPTFDWM